MILFFDTETTGFSHKHLPHDHPNQPHLVQLACVLTPDGKDIRGAVNLIVRPEGRYQIPRGSVDVHGITTEKAEESGVTNSVAVAAFLSLRSRATKIVAHNLPFDESIMNTAMSRAVGLKAPQLGSVPVQRDCTCELAEPVLKLPPTEKMIAAGFGHKFKKPNLGECVMGFFGEKLEGAHSAMVDAYACMRVYFHIANGGTLYQKPSLVERLFRR